MLLQAMLQEIDGQAMIQQGLADHAMLQVLKPESRPLAWRQALSSLLKGNRLLRLMPIQHSGQIAFSDSDRQDINKATKFLNVLKKSNFYDRMLATLRAN